MLLRIKDKPAANDLHFHDLQTDGVASISVETNQVIIAIMKIPHDLYNLLKRKAGLYRIFGRGFDENINASKDRRQNDSEHRQCHGKRFSNSVRLVFCRLDVKVI
ncbi:hypothetical protein QYM36_016457 [Artemia franciscana]|uniref:Uncharacterized protein n=1 Tax=Artemia franciscana TaxID=6661 RepID=A0AA88HFB5_ARTSF|nr:hypothetical protein QYM36_016457 [Artemia franciscana]